MDRASYCTRCALPWRSRGGSLRRRLHCRFERWLVHSSYSPAHKRLSLSFARSWTGGHPAGRTFRGHQQLDLCWTTPCLRATTTRWEYCQPFRLLETLNLGHAGRQGKKLDQSCDWWYPIRTVYSPDGRVARNHDMAGSAGERTSVSWYGHTLLRNRTNAHADMRIGCTLLIITTVRTCVISVHGQEPSPTTHHYPSSVPQGI